MFSGRRRKAVAGMDLANTIIKRGKACFHEILSFLMPAFPSFRNDNPHNLMEILTAELFAHKHLSQ